MTLQQFYAEVGGSAEEVLSRLMSEGLVKKFLFRFLDDPDYGILVKAYGEEDWPTAFRAAHTIKGLCLTLGLGNLARSSSQLTEMLRDGFKGDRKELEELYTRVLSDYDKAIAALNEYKGGN